MPVEVADVELIGELRDDDLRRDELEHPRLVAPLVSLERRPHDPDVLLRHHSAARVQQPRPNLASAGAG